MHINMPDKVNTIIEELSGAGFEAYAVGGCVRDSLLDREPKDWDITTSASPGQVKALFPRTVDTGIEHGTVTVLIEGEGFEVTTYRIDGEYEDNRRPKEVMFTSDLKEDLRRRDFTINAMAYNRQDGLVDVFDGRQDLKRGVIRCVGEPEERFGEDALRMLRAVRFSAQLGFEIEAETGSAIRKMAVNLRDISAERIQVELVKTMEARWPLLWYQACELGMTGVILPLYHAWACRHEEEHKALLKAIEAAERNKYLRLALLFSRTGEEAEIKGILRGLRFDNETLRLVSGLVKWRGYEVAPVPEQVRLAVYKMGEKLFPLWIKMQKSLCLVEKELTGRDDHNRIEEIESIYNGILERRECVSLKGLHINGKDLLEIGVKPGKNVGLFLEELLLEVLADPLKNNRDYLLAQVRKKVETNK